MISALRDSHTLLFVDDEKNVLSALERVFRRERYTILTAAAGREALKLLESGSVDLVLSDHGMPEMSGVELLSRVKEKFPDVMRIILTGQSDTQMMVSAINHGEIFRFVHKPWDDEDLKAVVRAALEQYDLVRENRSLQNLTREQNEKLRRINSELEIRVQERTREIAAKNAKLDELYEELRRNFFDTIKVFVELMELHYPYLGGHSKRVAGMVRNLALRFGCNARETEFIETAALLHDIGLIGVPAELIEKPVRGLKPDEVVLIKQHPVLGQAGLETIAALRDVGVLIRCHHERFDGKGFPDGLRGEEIPLGSRMIAVAEAYDDIVHWAHSERRSPKEAAFAYLKEHRGRRFDPGMVDQFLDTVDRMVGVVQEVVVDLEDLRAGMVLSRDLRTGSGRLLLPKNTPLKASHVEKIMNFHRLDPIEQRIYVRQKAEKDTEEASSSAAKAETTDLKTT